MSRLAYFQDLLLPTYAKDLVPTWSPQTTQTFQGVDRARGLVVPNSRNFMLRLDVVCFWAPESNLSSRGFRARELSVVGGSLIARSKTAGHLCWIDDSTKSKVVGSFSTPAVTSNGHGFVNGDRVLIRRSGYYTVVPVSNVTTNTFDISGATLTPTAADEIHLVERCFYGVVYEQTSPIRASQGGTYFSEEVTYSFVGDGATTYARTSVS